ncbi:MAG: GNAT family N-acetyltransferase [Oscillospiraceae bacterium]|nr:GNAT family N-acetyltransferase [Oscillospiraceae bacterium]
MALIDYIIYDDIKDIADEIFEKIAKFRWNIDDEKLNKTVKWMKQNNFGENFETKWFYVIAYSNNEIVGFIYFMKDKQNMFRWYLGDLSVNELYQRQGIAANLIQNGIEKIKNYQGTILHTYIEKDNIPSIKLHEKLGFYHCLTFLPFMDMIFDENITMYERIL